MDGPGSGGFLFFRAQPKIRRDQHQRQRQLRDQQGVLGTEGKTLNQPAQQEAQPLDQQKGRKGDQRAMAVGPPGLMEAVHATVFHAQASFKKVSTSCHQGKSTSSPER